MRNRFSVSLLLFLLGSHQIISQCWPRADKLVPQVGLNSRELFATSIDYEDDIGVVGATNSDSLAIGGGLVYVFQFEGGTWRKIASLAPSDPSRNQGFGRVVKISGDYIYVGDPFHYDGAIRKGLVYIFKKQGGVWQDMTESYSLLTSDPDVLGFGASLDNFEDKLMVGAPYSLNGSANVGAAYIFTQIGDTWTQEAKFSPSNILGSTFGSNVALKKNLAVVVATDEQTATSSRAGSAYVFHKNDMDSWANTLPNAKLSLSISPSLYAWLGIGLAIDESRQSVFVSASVYEGPLGKKRMNCYIKPAGGWHDMTETVFFDSYDPDLYAYIAQIQFEEPYLYLASGDGVKVFQPDATNLWNTQTPMAALRNSDQNPAKRFANSLAVSNGHVLVGATAYFILNRDEWTMPATPGVYEFIAPLGGWVNGTTYNQDFEFTYMPKTAADFAFGHSIDIDGDYAVVSATRDIANNIESGAVYVYKIDGLTWQQVAKLTPSDGEHLDYFGKSVAISQNHIAVGSPYKELRVNDTGAITYFTYGAVYVFERPGGGWIDMTETYKIINHDIEGSQKDDNEFGVSLDMDYPNLVVSRYNSGSRPNFGAAYVYNLSGEEPRLEATLNPSTRSNINNFGLAIKIKRDVITVSVGGSRFFTFDPNLVFVYTKKGNVWTNSFEDALLYPSDASGSFQGIFFGASVDLNETATKIIVGAPGWAEPGASIQDRFKGAAYIFEKPAGGWRGSISETAKLTVPGQPGFGNMGVSVHIEDRYAVVGSPQNYNTIVGAENPGPGRVYFYQEPETGWEYKLPDKIIRGDEANLTDSDYFGLSVDGVFGFLMIGAIADDNQNSVNAGSAYIYTEYPFIFPSRTPVCENEEPLQLEAYPTGGLWAGNGIVLPAIPSFDPSSSGIGLHKVKYKVDDCDASNSLLIEVKRAVQPFTLAATDSLFFCGNPEMNLSAPSELEIVYHWEYSEHGSEFIALSEETHSTLKTSTEGFYRVTLANSCSSASDSRWVGDLHPDAGESFALCATDQAHQLKGNYSNGVWSGPGTSPEGGFASSIAGPGKHVLIYAITQELSCVYEDTIVVEVKGIPSLNIKTKGDNAFCYTGTTVLEATPWQTANYEWYYGRNESDIFSLGKHSNVINAHELGYYRVKVDDGLCQREASYWLVPDFDPQLKPAFDSLSFCANDPIQIEVRQIPDAKYTWSRFDDDVRHIVEETTGSFRMTIEESGKYELKIASHGCEFSSPPMTANKIPADSLFVPNVITPNGDGINDALEIFTSEGISTYSLVIFNRYGKDVFRYSGSDRKPGWSGNNLSSGVYFWGLSYFDRCANRNKVFNGTLTVIGSNP